ncbi:hypothetical protein FGK60_27750 [Streptomyces sp. DASNCL29]|nr:hypothetical protein FGK60_27750 [Streptomyces sp. DASNCL29]
MRSRQRVYRSPGRRRRVARILDESGPSPPGKDQAMNTTIRMRAEASDGGRVHRAGRDQHLTER